MLYTHIIRSPLSFNLEFSLNNRKRLLFSFFFFITERNKFGQTEERDDTRCDTDNIDRFIAVRDYPSRRNGRGSNNTLVVSECWKNPSVTET